jgi:hypothetical protein
MTAVFVPFFNHNKYKNLALNEEYQTALTIIV